MKTKNKKFPRQGSAKPYGVLIVFLVILGLAILGYFIYRGPAKPDEVISENGAGVVPKVEIGPVAIPQKILENKFGFLSAGFDDYLFMNGVGAGWVRPHPGAFLWDAMQENKGADYNFVNTDRAVKKYQEHNLAILATLWPFAEWDQKSRDGFDLCAVNENDEFLLDITGKRGEEYIAQHRCAPMDWTAYTAWVKNVVERYDGDGNADMPGLKIPIKYWEVMNEPDLDGNDRLDFWKDSATAYAQLLVRTSAAIKEADPEARVVIAGAAGGDKRFLDFYRSIFKQKEVIETFDIANVHCISNDAYDSFNVEPYKKMLAEFKINKPIWVTEAEAIVSADMDVNATQTMKSADKALSLGAERIFFTRYDFGTRGDLNDRPMMNVPLIKAEISGKDPEAAYKKIISQ